MDLLKLKLQILCRGIKATPPKFLRRGGAGPSGGIYIKLTDKSCVNAPITGKFVKNTSISLDSAGILRINGERLKFEIIKPPKFYELKTSDGIPMWMIARLHGLNCIASTVIQICTYWRRGLQCHFCGIELSYRRGITTAVKKGCQLREVIEASKNVGEHVTLTIGSLSTPDRGAKYLAKVVKCIRKTSNVPIHVQVEPPKRREYLDQLHKAEADTVGIHIETFDESVRRRICPGKIKLNLKDYIECWKHSVNLFGENQVSSFIIVGLGEDFKFNLKGCEILSRIGVIPYLLPLRPIPGTKLEDETPPKPSHMERTLLKACEIMREYGVNPFDNKAGCVRCDACSALKEAYSFAK